MFFEFSDFCRNFLQVRGFKQKEQESRRVPPGEYPL